jgi:hypothetical protein
MTSEPTASRTVGRNSDLYTLPQDQGAEADRAAARKALATMICKRHGVNPSAELTSDGRSHLAVVASEFALLADILGLNPAPPAPLGCCPRCGDQLSIGAARDQSRHSRVCRARDRS